MNTILSSYSNYGDNGPYYQNDFGKRIQQDLHHWIHNASYAKWHYAEDPGDEVFWQHFYKALHDKPLASEKIVNLIKLGGSDGAQIWVYY